MLHRVETLAHDFEQPVRVRHPLHWIGHVLHGCGDSHDLLDGRAKPLAVVVPVENAPNVDGGVHEGRGVAPLFEVHHLHGLFGLEDLDGNGTLRDWSALGRSRHDVLAVEPLVFDHISPEELGDAVGSGDSHRLAVAILLHCLAHAGLL